jgi:hypothetical protein
LAKYYIQQNNIKKKITKIIQFDESTVESEEDLEKGNKVERVTDIIIGGSSS